MIVKIGGVFLNLCEIAAAEYNPATKLDPEFMLVTLRSGSAVCVYCSEAEFENLLRSRHRALDLDACVGTVDL